MLFGASTPGLPYFYLGRSQYMAFGVTTLSSILFLNLFIYYLNTVGDNADTFEETLDST